MAVSTQAVPQFAKHPLTGAPIRIMTTEASVWRDQKTLVWLDAAAAAQAAAKRWNRFEVGVASKEALDAAQTAGLRVEVAMALGGDLAAWVAWMAAGGWESVALLAVPKSLVEHIGLVELRAMKIKNMICIDEMHELYPFVGGAWTGSEDDAKVLLALALHMGRTGPVADLAAAALTRPLRGLTLLAELPVPAPLWLVQQYYKPGVARRRKEIDACLKANVENPLIDRIVLLNEEACLPAPAAAGKVEERVIGKRLTYADVFRWIAAEAGATGAIVAFANSDVFLDTSSTRLLWSADLTNKFLALLRWDVEGTDAAAQAAAKLFGPRPDSQDCWVVAADSVRAAFKDEASFAGLDFPFGQGGCDNAITLELLRRKFVVANPALTLRTYHYHTSAVRNYDPRNIVSKPAYLYVQPTGFHDMRPDLGAVPTGATQIPWRRRTFARPVAGPSSAAQLRTFCTMVGRATSGAVVLDVEGANLLTSPAVTLFRATDVFQTREGLTFGYDSIHVGRTKAAQEAWGASELSSMAAALPVEAAAAVPLPDAVARDPARYVLEYLAKVFVLQKLSAAASPLEFFCANEPKCIEAVKMFAWPQGQVPVVSRDETQQAWCGEAFVWPYSDEPAGFPSQEEVAALRGALGLGGWLPVGEATDEKRLVVVVDGAVVTDATVEALESLTDVDVIWPGRTDLQHGLGLLRGAAGLVVAAGSPYASWAWALPLGAAVWELQSEMRPSAALLHLCGAADLHHRLLITPKGAMGDAERAAATAKLVADVRLMLGLLGPVPTGTDSSSKPLLLMPAGHKGFFDHAGDSFRETARLWAQRGFVELTESSLVTQIWLGAAGKTLLYDRPTLEWLRAAPAEEQTYQLALFGNPAPPATPAGKGQANAKAWIFWPRRPNLVESLVAVGLPATPFEARPDGLVFYGRSENAVQLGNRKKEDWSKACGKFVHVEGTGAYPFTHEEYLVNLSKARFGLCLAGYGRKCHREVECMAMGCVPIVAPEVDMTSYAEPPQPGVHFFRVGGPAEAAALVASITPLRWAAMSAACRAWWRRNASVEGAWEVTRRLIAA
jgi:hypothetical protein